MRDPVWTRDYVFVPYEQDLANNWRKLGWLRVSLQDQGQAPDHPTSTQTSVLAALLEDLTGTDPGPRL